MFGSNPGSTSLFGNPPATGLGASTGFSAGSGFGTGTLGTAGTLFSSTSLANTTALSNTKSGFTFGQPTTSTAATSTFFGGTGSAANASAIGLGTAAGGGLGSTFKPSTGFSFGTSTAPTTTTVSSFPTLTGFGNLSQPSLSTGLFSGVTSASTTAPSFGLGGFGAPAQGFTATAASNQPFVPTTGLGGVGVLSTTTSKSDSKTLKEYPVPPEISDLVESFKIHIKTQKALREEISHMSSKSLNKVVDETEDLKQTLSVISNGLQRNAASIRKLKLETVKELKNAEIMQRTKDTPFPLQYENTAPMEYFSQLIVDFEQRMALYRQQIDSLEKHLLLITESSSLTPQDLLQTIKKLHDAFICIAAQLQVVEENVEQLKERFAKMGKNFYNPAFDQGESRSPAVWPRSVSVPISVGPSPLGITHASVVTAFTTAYERAQQMTGAPSGVNVNSSYQGNVLGASGFGSSLQSRPLCTTPLSSLGATSGLSLKALGSSTTSNVGAAATSSLPTTPVFGVSNQSAFQLQKPPIGNKRGKR